MQPSTSGEKQRDENLDRSPRGIALYNSDTDDWTFVSSASSGGNSSRDSSNSSSPERAPSKGSAATTALCASTKQPTTSFQAPQTGAQQSDSTSSEPPVTQQRAPCGAKKHISHHNKRKLGSSERADDADDESDGMTEINLSDHNDEHVVATMSGGGSLAIASMNDGAEYDVLEDYELQSSKVNDTGIVEAISQQQRRDSDSSSPLMITESALAEQKSISTSTGQTHSTLATYGELKTRHKLLKSRTENLKLRERELSWRERELSRRDLRERDMRGTPSYGSIFFPIFTGVAIALVCSQILKPANLDRKDPKRSRYSSRLPVSNVTFDQVYSDPTNHAYTELKLMNEDMLECIRRENPNSQEIEHWLSMSSQELARYHTTQTNIRPFKGLVCYENEVEWRKRFNKLKSEFSMDLRKITRQIKRKITNEMLQREHPSMRFRLILNQLEYLDHIDQRRKDRTLEKLKAENLDLARRLNKKSPIDDKNNKSHNHEQQQQRQHHHQKHHKSQRPTNSNSLISLERENNRLKHEVESLKARLAEKAGPVYIKQSLELENCGRENNALKQFHHQVSEEVLRYLRQLDKLPHPMDSLAVFERNLDDSLSSRLALTLAHLEDLGEEISQLTVKNGILERNLKAAQSLNELILADTKNLIEDTNGTDRDARQLGQQQHQVGPEIIDTSTLEQFKAEGYLIESELRPSSTLEQQQQQRDIKVDWLSKRAKLREKLRRGTTIDGEYARKQQHHTPSTGIKDNRNAHLKKAKRAFLRYTGEIREDELPDWYVKQHVKPSPASSPSANSYDHNSYKNCKSHLRRDEL